MKKTVGLILMVILAVIVNVSGFGPGPQPLEAKKKSKNPSSPYDQLSPKYKKWLDEVTYIITKSEKEVFNRLQTDRERDIFINAFWQHRDPTAGTPENEFKEEHYRRLRQVETLYSRGGRREGWKMDRGKVYIILGPPLAIQRFDTYTRVYPTEVWHYQQAPKYGLPPAFNVVFFDKYNTGEYYLYSPLGDGPQKLLIGFNGKPDDYLKAYEELKEFNIFLAKTSISLVPGEEADVGRPSMSSEFLLRNIADSPKKQVEDIYARKFLKYKGMVEVEYSVNYVLNKSLSQLIQDKEGNNFFNYIIEFKKLSVDQYDDFFHATIEIYGSLADPAGKKTIYQFEKTYNVKLDAQQFQHIQDSSFAITDQFPIIPGDYRLSILVKNVNSKEFTAYETDLSVPHPEEGKIYLSTPLMAYDVRGRNLPSPAEAAAPFGTSKGTFLVDPESRFSRLDDMNVFFQLTGLSNELRSTGKIKLDVRGERNFTREITRALSEFPGQETDFLLGVPLQDLPSDYYTLEVSIVDKTGTPLASQTRRFMITPLNKIARPQTFSKYSSLDRDAVTAFVLGTQYMNTDNLPRALRLMQKAHNLNPTIMQFALGLAQVYFEQGDYSKIEPLLEPFANPEKPDFQMYFMLGNANQQMKKYPEAVKYYQRLIIYHGLNADVLNCLASCYYNMGELGEARKAWDQSLKVDPGQEKVKQALKELKK
jgi:GWxTD domain-containing protein